MKTDKHLIEDKPVRHRNKPNRMSDAENCLFTPIYGSIRVAREKWRK